MLETELPQKKATAAEKGAVDRELFVFIVIPSSTQHAANDFEFSVILRIEVEPLGFPWFPYERHELFVSPPYLPCTAEGEM